MRIHATRRRGYVRPKYDLPARGQVSGAATAAWLVPLALCAGGFMLWKRSTQVVEVAHDPNALPGMSGFGGGALPGMGALGGSFRKKIKSVNKAVQKVTDNKVLRPVLAVATVGMSEATRRAAKLAADPSGQLKRIDPVKLASQDKLMGKSPLIRKLRPRGSRQDTTPAAPGQAIIYQDINGTVVSEAEYNAIMQAMGSNVPVQIGSKWALPAGYLVSSQQYTAMTGGSIPVATSGGGGGGSSSGTSFTTIYTPEGEAPNQAPGGGGSAPASYDLGPEAPAPEQQYANSPADAPAPAVADKKFNPLIAIGALIAVPVVMGLTGAK